MLLLFTCIYILLIFIYNQYTLFLLIIASFGVVNSNIFFNSTTVKIHDYLFLGTSVYHCNLVLQEYLVIYRLNKGSW